MCPCYGLGFPSLHKTCDLDQFAEATDETAKKIPVDASVRCI